MKILFAILVVLFGTGHTLAADNTQSCIAACVKTRVDCLTGGDKDPSDCRVDSANCHLRCVQGSPAAMPPNIQCKTYTNCKEQASEKPCARWSLLGYCAFYKDGSRGYCEEVKTRICRDEDGVVNFRFPIFPNRR